MKSVINIGEHSLIISNSLVNWFNYNSKKSWMLKSEILVLNLSLNEWEELFISIDSFGNHRVFSFMIFWIHQRLLHFSESIILICSHWIEVNIRVSCVLLIEIICIEQTILVDISIDIIRYSYCQYAYSVIVFNLSWIHLKKITLTIMNWLVYILVSSYIHL